jgi:hypothetical protein
LNDTQQFSGNLLYATVGFSALVGRAKKNEIGMHLELGVADMEGTDAFSDAGYNGAPFSIYSNTAVRSQTNWYAVTGSFDRRFTRRFSAGANLGYKICNFQNFTYTKVDSNFSSFGLSQPQVGDTAKNSSNGNFSYDFSGLIASANIAFHF